MNKSSHKVLYLAIFFFGFSIILFLIKVFILEPGRTWQASLINTLVSGIVSTALLSFFTIKNDNISKFFKLK
jgi:hypothetical protein